jgi:hypothetical protein
LIRRARDETPRAVTVEKYLVFSNT